MPGNTLNKAGHSDKGRDSASQKFMDAPEMTIFPPLAAIPPRLELLFFKIVVQLQLSPYFLHYSSLPYPPPTSHIQSSPPLSLSIGPLYTFLDLPPPLLF